MLTGKFIFIIVFLLVAHFVVAIAYLVFKIMKSPKSDVDSERVSGEKENEL